LYSLNNDTEDSKEVKFRKENASLERGGAELARRRGKLEENYEQNSY